MARVANFDPLRMREIARAPYALVLFAYLQLVEYERIQGVADRFREVARASFTAAAFNDPQRIDRAHEALMSEVGMANPRTSLSHRAEQMLAEAAAHAARKEQTIQ